MTGIATGVYKKLAIKRQTGLGAIAAAIAGGARYLRRVTCTLDIAKASYSSTEQLESQQVRDMRHGVRSVAGTLAGLLSVGTYQQLFESILRQGAQVGVTTAAQTNITAASAGANTGQGTFTRAAGSFITDGFKVGDIINTTGWTTTAVGNNNSYGIITNLTATVMSVLNLDKTDVFAKASGDSVIILTVGKKIWVPTTGQTRDYYTVEHWFADIGQSEVFTDVVFTEANVGLPPSGNATVSFPMMGLNMTPAQAQYFQTPVPSSTGPILASVNGALIINGVVAGLVTGLTIAIKGSYAYPAGDGVVGQNTHPDIMPGIVMVTGQATVLFVDTTFRDLFLNETESTIAVVLTGDNSAAPAFTSFVMPRVKFSGASKDDNSNTGLTLTMPFTALEQATAGGAGFNALDTTISVQDSAFV